MLKTKEEIKLWLETYSIQRFTIHDDLTVNVHQSVNIREKELTEIPIQFDVIQGDFNASCNQLTQLPLMNKVQGELKLDSNKIVSLENFPYVHTNIYLQKNNITSLKGLPEKVNGWLVITSNPLNNFEHAPKFVKGDFICSDLPLESLKHLPKSISGDLHMENVKVDIFNDIEIAKIRVGKNIVMDANNDKYNDFIDFHHEYNDGQKVMIMSHEYFVENQSKLKFKHMLDNELPQSNKVDKFKL